MSYILSICTLISHTFPIFETFSTIFISNIHTFYIRHIFHTFSTISLLSFPICFLYLSYFHLIFILSPFFIFVAIPWRYDLAIFHPPFTIAIPRQYDQHDLAMFQWNIDFQGLGFMLASMHVSRHNEKCNLLLFTGTLNVNCNFYCHFHGGSKATRDGFKIIQIALQKPRMRAHGSSVCIICNA